MQGLAVLLLGVLLLAGCGPQQSPEFSSAQHDADDLEYPAYANLAHISVASNGKQLKVAFESYGFLPEILPRGEDWHARAYLDTDSDDSPDYYVAYEVYPFDTRAKFYDYTTESHFASVHFPGTYKVGTNSVELSVPLEQLNYPVDIQWYAVSEWNAYTIDSTRDWVPSDDVDRWINAITDQ